MKLKDNPKGVNDRRTKYVIIALVATLNFMVWWSQHTSKLELQQELDEYRSKLNKIELSKSSLSESPLHLVDTTDKKEWNYHISVPVLRLDPYTRKIVLPSEIKRLWFDVGAHKESMMCRPSLFDQEDLGIIAFEPMYDMWGNLFMKEKHERLFSIPAAVGTEEGWGTFRRATTDMCSSLKGVHPDANRKDWPGGCTETKFEVKVPVVRLETIIEHLPSDMNVEFMKIDAQGADYEVVASAGKLLSRINMVVVEVQVNKPLYDEAKSEQDYIDLFEKHGFEC